MSQCTPADVETLAKIMKEYGLTVVTLQGMTIERPAQPSLDMAKMVELAAAQAAAPKVTDEEILRNPLHGLSFDPAAEFQRRSELEGLTNG